MRSVHLYKGFKFTLNTNYLSMQDTYLELNLGSSWQKQHSSRTLFFTNKLDLNILKKLVKCYIKIIVLCGAETW